MELLSAPSTALLFASAIGIQVSPSQLRHQAVSDPPLVWYHGLPTSAAKLLLGSFLEAEEYQVKLLLVLL